MTATDKEERIRFLGVPIAVIAAADHHAHTGEDDPAPAQPGCGQAQLETERPAHSKIPAIIRQIHAIVVTPVQILAIQTGLKIGCCSFHEPNRCQYANKDSRPYLTTFYAVAT